jgi:hypothetical protein
MVDIQTSEVDAKLVSVSMGPQYFFCADRSSKDEQLLIRSFLLKSKKNINIVVVEI